MAATGQDNIDSWLMGLSGTNVAVLGGMVDSTISGNATVTLLIAAIQNLAPLAGTAPDALRQAGKGLRFAVNAGYLAETHSLTTVAGLRAVFTAQLPGVPSTYTGSLPQ